MHIVDIAIVVGDPTGDAVECETCGFDSVLTFPLTSIDERGVSPFGNYRRCVRCFEETGIL